jgi:hypothetical protein
MKSNEKLKIRNGKLVAVFFALTIVHLPLTVTAQSGGQFAITQSVVAGGGGGPSTGGIFGVTGTAGQASAGVSSSNTPFGVRGGFWQNDLAPTAAGVAVSGRVMTTNGSGLRNAFVTLTNSSGVTISVRTSTFGYYRFEDVAAGQTYIVNVKSKRFTFTPRIIAVTDELTDVDFIADTLD